MQFLKKYKSTKSKLRTESDEGQPSPTSELLNIRKYLLHNCGSSNTCTKYKISCDEDLDSEPQNESCYCAQSGVNYVSRTERD